MNVTPTYIAAQRPTHHVTTLKTVWLILNKNMRRLAKKRKRERCRSVGNASTAQGRCSFSMPSAKNAWIHARLWGLYHVWVILMYRHAHCCSNMARRLHVRLMARLKNQSVLTQTVYVCGENASGIDGVEGTMGLDLLGSERS